jgi:hypothetical protein
MREPFSKKEYSETRQSSHYVALTEAIKILNITVCGLFFVLVTLQSPAITLTKALNITCALTSVTLHEHLMRK